MPHAANKASLYVSVLTAAMAEFEINMSNRIDMFLATIAHESADLQCVEENLNYSAAGLCKTFGKYFPTLSSALPYNRAPEKIANKVYANRGGNGSEASGDGWRYRGAGLIQLTFKSNQHACGAYFKIADTDISMWLRTPEGAARSAAWFWKIHGCNEFADRCDFDGVCDMVNIGHKTAAIGDAIGYVQRVALLNTAQGIMA